MYLIYLSKYNIIIPQYMFTCSCTAPPNEYYVFVFK